MLKNDIEKGIKNALKFSWIDQKIIQSFTDRLKQEKLIRDENPEDHFCVFFIPYHKETKQIYLGHHKKANDWIPPGGHIEKDETLLDTVKREAKEELDFKITTEKIELFTIDSLDVSSPNRRCKIHHHIWYLLFLDKLVDFNYTNEEFYDAKWFTIEEALKIIRIPSYRNIVSNL